MIAVSVALTGAADSPAVMWPALPAVTLGARFELRGVLLGVAFLIGLLLFCTLGLEARAVFERPDTVIFPIALVIATAMSFGAAAARGGAVRFLDLYGAAAGELPLVTA